MSGVYIKGMEMPLSCHECVAGLGGYCYVAPPETDGVCPNSGRAKFCPLIPVPDHGRLIDADALCKTLRNLAENEYTPTVFANWIEHHIDTIIPADKENGK